MKTASKCADGMTRSKIIRYGQFTRYAESFWPRFGFILGAISLIANAANAQQVGESNASASAGSQSEVNRDATPESISADSTDASGAEVPPTIPALETPATKAKDDTHATSGGIAEIIVTAQKRAENIQSVPIAITAFSADQLENKGVTDPSKLQALTPGLVYDSTAGFSIVYIRGIGTDAFIPSADQSVATYVDGVYFPFAFGLARAFGAVERVEVLKGPQGTLFGRNATGGAIDIVNKDPSDKLTGSVASDYANFNTQSNRAYFSTPLTDTLGVAIGGVYNTGKDYYHFAPNPPPNRLADTLSAGATFKLKWKPVDYFDGTFSAYGFYNHATGTALAVQLDPKPLGKTLGVDGPLPDYETDVNSGQTVGGVGGVSKVYVGSTTLNFRLKPFDLKSISAYQTFGANSLFDFDGSRANVASFGDVAGHDRNQFGRVFTQELQVLSNDSTWGADRFKWIAGGFYLRSTAGFDPVNFYLEGLENALSAGTLTTSPALSSVENLISNLKLPTAGSHLTIYGLLDTESVAGYLQGTYKIFESLSATVGGRYQKESRRVYDTQTDVTLDPSEQTTTVFSFAPQSLSKGDFSPKFNLDYHPAFLPESLFYATWSRAFKSGSFNIINLDTPPTEIKPEQVTSIELGTKNDFFEHRLRINGAAYYNRVKDLQVQFLSLLSGGVVQFENAQKASVRGAELDAIANLFGGLSVNTGFSLDHGQYDVFTGASGFNTTDGTLSENNNFSGNSIVRNPRQTYSAGIDYNVEVPGGVVDVGGDFYHNSGYFFDAQNVTTQPSYYTVSARANYLYERFNLRLSLFGENLNGAKYYLYKFPNDFGTVGKLASPRTYGARLSWDFGT